MKKIILLSIIIYSTSIFSQEKKEKGVSEFIKFKIQCEHIGKAIIDKNAVTDIYNWYEGIDEKNSLSNLKQLKSDINNSELEVTYLLTLLNRSSEDPIVYMIHFYDDQSKIEFGRLFIRFKDKNNNLVDDIRVANKATIEGVEENPIIKH